MLTMFCQGQLFLGKYSNLANSSFHKTLIKHAKKAIRKRENTSK